MDKSKLLIVLLICLAFSCKEKAPDISKLTVDLKLIRFDEELFKTPIDQLENKIPEWEAYGDFFKFYNEEIISLGSSQAPDYISNLKMFLGNEIVRLSYDEAQEVFMNNSSLYAELNKAFRYVRYYFPNKKIPEIYTYVAGFNQSLMLGEGFIGIGLDKYLGSNYETYKLLGLYQYLIQNMYKEKIPSDCICAYALGEWPFNDKESSLIAKMVYEGLLLYFTRQILPEATETQIFGFTENQLTWCKMNEGQMWAHLINDKLIYSQDRFTIIKLTEDAPYTAMFTPDSPGKACNWIGYRIVESYMNRNNISLEKLMATESYQSIFDNSKYKPKR